MTIHKLLLRFYPRIWRVRYEEEVLDVLASHPFSFFEGIDVMRGALDAHLHPCFGTTAMSFPERLRQMLSTLRRCCGVRRALTQRCNSLPLERGIPE